MSIDIGSKGIVGAYLEEFRDVGTNEDKLRDMIDEGDLDYVSPYYDSPREEWFIGFQIANEWDSPNKMHEEIVMLWKEFQLQFGFEPTFLISPHVI
jgi:hypothetical protein